MPIGIITDVSVTFLGALLGVFLGRRVKQDLKNALYNILGVAAITMGIVLIMKVHTLPAVILSLLLGCLTGELLRLENGINNGVSAVVGKFMGKSKPHPTHDDDHDDDDEFVDTDSDAKELFLMQVSSVVVLFCCGGTGWYGALSEGLTGDGSILITKSILDGATALIFGSILGGIVPTLCIPQLLVYLVLFLISGLVQPFITPEMIADFSAVGGIVTLCAGLRLTGIKKDIKVLNLLPALILVFFVSGIWSAVIG